MSLLNSVAQIDFGKLADHTKTTEFEAHVIPEGLHPGRVVQYIELGKHTRKADPKFNRKAGIVNQVYIAIELSGRALYDITVEGETKKARPLVSGTFALSTHGRATFKKLFDVIRDGDEKVTHGAQLLGRPVLVRIKHVKEKNDKGEETGKVYSNWRTGENAVPDIQPPVIEDPETGEIRRINPIPVDESNLKLLVWDSPSKEQWDSLYIAGTRTEKRGDVEVEVSKNWLQEKVLSAVNFEGSVLHDLLTGLNLDLTIPEREGSSGPDTGALDVLPDDTPEPKKPAQTPSQPPVAPKTPAPPAADVAAAEVADVLATLGL